MYSFELHQGSLPLLVSLPPEKLERPMLPGTARDLPRLA